MPGNHGTSTCNMVSIEPTGRQSTWLSAEGIQKKKEARARACTHTSITSSSKRRPRILPARVSCLLWPWPLSAAGLSPRRKTQPGWTRGPFLHQRSSESQLQSITSAQRPHKSQCRQRKLHTRVPGRTVAVAYRCCPSNLEHVQSTCTTYRRWAMHAPSRSSTSSMSENTPRRANLIFAKFAV